MLPLLANEDYVIVDKIAYRVGDIHHGDVVVLQSPRNHNISLIKRVIALPGENVRIDYGTVYVNGSRLDEPYLLERYNDIQTRSAIVVPPDEYFVMGDHRSRSTDSRNFGPVGRDLIRGKAVFVYWPIRQIRMIR